MAGLNSGNAANAIKTALDVVFEVMPEYLRTPNLGNATDPLVFRQLSTSNAAYISEQLQGTGYFATKAEQADVSGATARVGNQKTSTVLEFAQSVDVPRTFLEDDMHDVVESTVRQMKQKAVLTRDRNACEIYNLGFSTETTNDAVALFSNSHTTLNGTTVDNLETGTLAVANLETGIVSLMEQRDQDGTLAGFIARCLFTPVSLMRESTEILDSELRSGTGNNDINWTSRRFPGLELRFNQFLGAAVGSSGSDVRWFLLAQEHNIARIEREGLWTELVAWQNQRNNNYIYKAGYREVVDALSWQGAVGSNGTV